MSKFYSVERLSLSRLGRMLMEKLGQDADQYEFPDDFEQAVNDIGFKGIVFDGSTAPYDAVVVGRLDVPYGLTTIENNNAGSAYIDSIEFVGTGSTPLVIPQAFCRTSNTLTEVTLPSNTTQIDGYAFAYCSSLTTVSGTENITVLKGYAFAGCTNLTSFPDGFDKLTTATGGYVFENCGVEILHLPAFTTMIADYVFKNQYFKELYLPRLINLRGNVFNGSTSLEYLQIGSIGYGVSSVYSSAFNGLTQAGLTIEFYSVPASIDTFLTTIRNYATNATIIIKAPVDLVYNGDSYSAGDTVITSTPS